MVEMSNQITGSNISKNVLLLGAGFTKNFDGLLADEMWAEIFNHKEIQAQPRIIKLMLNNFDYEDVYYSVLEKLTDKEGMSSKFNFEEKEAIMKAAKAAYEIIDERLRYQLQFASIDWTYKLNRLLSKFGKTNKNSFIFTLNQDLLIERFYTNPSPTALIQESKLSIPGIKDYPIWFMNIFHHLSNHKLPIEEKNSPYYKLKDSDYCTLPSQDEFDQEKDSLLENGNYFLIKLHGSYNWKRSDGSRAMVIGRGKSEQIDNEPLLKEYYRIFKNVFSQKNLHLLVIGYGFGDEHINRVLSNAVAEYKMKIYILSPEAPKKFKEKLCGKNKTLETINIWNGISGYFQCVEDVLLKYGNDYKAKDRFYEAYFSDEQYSS